MLRGDVELAADRRHVAREKFDIHEIVGGADGPAVVILTAFDYPQFVDAALRLGGGVRPED